MTAAACRDMRQLSLSDRELIYQAKQERQRMIDERARLAIQIKELSDHKLAEKFETTLWRVQRC